MTASGTTGCAAKPARARLLISCVRNPYTRALSGYLDMVRGNNAVQYPELRKGPPASFIEHLETLSVMRPEMMNSHFRPQHINLDVPNITYDATFFLENIAALPQVLRNQLGGFDLKTFAPHARGASAEMESQYSARAVDLVQQRLRAGLRALRLQQGARRFGKGAGRLFGARDSCRR